MLASWRGEEGLGLSALCKVSRTKRRGRWKVVSTEERAGRKKRKREDVGAVLQQKEGGRGEGSEGGGKKEGREEGRRKGGRREEGREVHM